MDLLDTDRCYRATSTTLGRLLRLFPYAAAFARRHAPTGIGKLYAVTRYDDVLQVFATDEVFDASYAQNLAVLTDDEPFFLGLRDGPEYRAQVAAMRAVMTAVDLPALADAAEALAEETLAAADGEIDVVAWARRTAFDVIARYLGIPEPAEGRLAVWGSRLFEFQFAGSVGNAPWLAEARQFAAALRTHIDRVIAERKRAGGPDDVLRRCFARQAAGEPGYGDVQVRTALLCMLVGGPPQPAMVLPNALEQMLRRPGWLTRARAAARDGDDLRLHDIVFEAMRFDPLAPVLKRHVLRDHVLAEGTGHARRVPAGATVWVSFASAMLDPRRVADPTRFDPERSPADYIHFGHGLHECFGKAINHATLHRILKPLLARPTLVRAPNARGKLRKVGVFADRLIVRYG